MVNCIAIIHNPHFLCLLIISETFPDYDGPCISDFKKRIMNAPFFKEMIRSIKVPS